MRPNRFVAAALALGALALLTGAARAPEEAISLTRDGVERTAKVVDGDPDGMPKPLVIMLHGGSGSGEQIRRVGFDAFAKSERIVLAYPDGRGGGWMDGRRDSTILQRSGEVDDVGFLDALVDRLVQSGRVDPRRVTVVGISNGGMMALRLACDRADRYAGVVAIVALLPESLAERCRPARPLPLMLMVGTKDQFIPVGGGPVAGFLGQSRGAVVSLDRTLAVLKPALGCAGEPSRAQLPDVDAADGVRTERLDWRACKGRGRLTLLKMEGAGHGWPGRPRRPSGTRLDDFRGTVTTDFDAARVSLDFLKETAFATVAPGAQAR